MTKVILGVVIAGLMLGYVFPVGLNQVNEDPTYSVTLDEGNEEVVQEGVNTTVTSSTAGSSATIEVVDTQTGDNVTKTINVGDSAQYELDSGYVNVTVNSVNSGTPNTVNADYTVEQGFAWSDGSRSIFQILGLFLVIVPLVVLAREAMRA